MGAFGVVWLALNRMDGLSTAEQTVALGVGMAVLSGIAKVWSENSLTQKLLAKVGLASLVLLVLTGCGVSLGHVTPHEFEGENGQTIIACEMRGIQLGVGDGGVCQNAEGGHVSDVFAGMWTATVDTVRTIVAAIFVPFSAIGAAGQSIAAAPPASFPTPPEEVPGIVVEPEQAGSGGGLFD